MLGLALLWSGNGLSHGQEATAPQATPSAAASDEKTEPQEPPVDNLDRTSPNEGVDPASPEIQAYYRAVEAVVQKSADLRLLGDNRPEPSKRAEYAAQLQAHIDEVDAAIDAAREICEVALAKYPGFREGEQFLLGAALRLVEQDRLEEAQRVAKLLESRHSGSIRLLNFLGRCAYELCELDEAERHFRRANDRQALEETNRQLLLKIDQMRPLVEAELARRAAEAEKDDLPRVLLKTTRGDVVIELFEDDQPNLVANFLTLVSRQFYDGLPFFRVVPAFGVTCGCPRGDGSDGPGYELSVATDKPPRLHQRGVVSMIRVGDQVHGSQFFIDYRFTALTERDKQMPVFGRVIEGLEHVSRLRRVDPNLPVTESLADRIVEAKIVRARPHTNAVRTTLSDFLDQVRAALKLASEGQRDQAIGQLQKLVEQRPDNFDGQLALGLAYEEAGRGQDALPHLEKALSVRPFHPELAFRVGVLLAQAKRSEEAVARFQEALKLRPDDMRCYNNLASMFARLGRKDDAVAALEAALKIDPNYEQARVNLTRLKVEAGAESSDEKQDKEP